MTDLPAHCYPIGLHNLFEDRACDDAVGGNFTPADIAGKTTDFSDVIFLKLIKMRVWVGAWTIFVEYQQDMLSVKAESPEDICHIVAKSFQLCAADLQLVVCQWVIFSIVLHSVRRSGWRERYFLYVTVTIHIQISDILIADSVGEIDQCASIL